MSHSSVRKVTDHRLGSLNEKIAVSAIGDPGPGGANQEYVIAIQRDNPVDGSKPREREMPDHWWLKFQSGNPAVDINGISNESLLAIVIDRLRGVQGLNPIVEGGELPKDPPAFACMDNAQALTHAMECLFWLQKRTRDRQARGVEGQQKA